MVSVVVLTEATRCKSGDDSRKYFFYVVNNHEKFYPRVHKGSRMPNIFNHGQKDGLQRGWLVLPSRLSSSKHSARPAVAVVRCCDDRNAPAKQPLFDYRPHGGLELKELLLPTLKVLLRRCLRSPDQSTNYHRHKSEHKRPTAFAAAVPHMEGAMAATLASSWAPQQAYQEFEVRSNSRCYNVPCHEGSQKEFCIDPVIKCCSSFYSEEGHPVDTKQSRNSARGRWHQTASTIQKGGSPARTTSAENAVADIKVTDQPKSVSTGEGIAENCRKPVSDSERRSTLLGSDDMPFHFAGFHSTKPKIIIIKERPRQDPVQVSERHTRLGSDPLVYVIPGSQLPNSAAVLEGINQESSKASSQLDRNPLAVNDSSRIVESSRSIWPTAAVHRLHGRRLCTVHLNTVASSSTESTPSVQCTQSQEFTSSLPATLMFSNESGSSSEV